jgi:hypothetical protein
MPIWSEQDALEMMRYGIVWKVYSVKPHVAGGQLIRYRLVKRKGKRFDFVGPLKTSRKWFEKPIKPGDLLFRDHVTKDWTRMEIIERKDDDTQTEGFTADEVGALDRQATQEDRAEARLSTAD